MKDKPDEDKPEKEPDLFDICRGRHRGNSNSSAANRETNKHRDRAVIMAHLRTVPDATSEEITLSLGMRHQTVSARMSELKRDGLLVATVRRPTSSGSMAQAWKPKDTDS